MQRIVIAVAISALVAACGDRGPADGEVGTPTGPLDYIDAVPIDEDAPPPVVEAAPEAKTEEVEAEKAEAEPAETEEAETEAAQSPAAPAPTRTAPVTPPPAAPSPAAATATRRANEAAAPRSATEVPYSPN